MKKLLALTVLLLIVFAGLIAQRNFLLHPEQKQAIISSQTQANTPTPPPTSPVADEVSIPRSISIPAIGVNAPLETVAMDSQGRMDVPHDANDAAWYSLGYRPGEKGSAVIDGHLDTVTGAPAVFWNIKNLQPGNTITVTDLKGKNYTFTVIKVANFPYDQVPMQQLFASNDKRRLHLITCGGTWDQGTHNYQQRTVVYSEML